ncbi:CBN-CYP-14A1 protein, partial [Aphelenchoides avenae]
EKIRAEIDSVIGTERAPTFVDRLQMPYTSAFIYEALRCSNVTTFETHISTSEQTVAGHRIRGGTIVVLQYCSVLAKDPMFDEPDKFKPERFLNADGTGIDKVGTSIWMS